jgi:tetratricopeptide (TPR) repeat protein
MGTPAYMAPEQHSGGQVDARTDQFGFCVALWEALHGEPPFAGESWTERAQNVIAGKLREPKHPVPARLQRAITRGLALAPGDRWESMDDLLEELVRGRGPWLTRGRALAAAGTLALAGLVVAGLGWRAGHQRVICTRGESKLAGVWDPARKQAIHAAFAATGKPYAEYAWKSVERIVDTWSGEWSTMYGEACEATWVRHEQSGAMLDLRMQCLDGRRSSLRALSDLLVAGDEQVLSRALDASASLDPVVECANTIALQHAVAPPPATVRPRVDEVRVELATARALHTTGKYREAKAMAEKIVERARELEYAPLEADGMVLLASDQAQLGDLPAAEATLEDALVKAETSGDDEVASRALILQVWVVGHDAARPAEGHKLARHAEAILQRRHANRLTEADLHYEDGMLYVDQGDYARGEPMLIQSLNERESAGLDHADVSYSLDGLGHLYAQMARYDDSLKVELRALAIREKAYGPEHPITANTMNNIGATLEALGRFDEALDYQRRALAIREKVLPAVHADLATSHVNLGILYYDKGKLDEALAEFKTALDLAERALGSEHRQVAETLDYVATLYAAKAQFAEALPYFERGLALAEKVLGAKHPLAAEMRNGIGQCLLNLGRLDEATVMLEQALAMREATSTDPAELADTRFGLAKAVLLRDAKRAHALAEQARDGMKHAGVRGKQALPEIEAWLQAHP